MRLKNGTMRDERGQALRVPRIPPEEVCMGCVAFPRWRWLRERARTFGIPLGLILTLLLFGVGPAAAASNVLTWTDNATNEVNQKIERTTAADVAACQTAPGFTQIATVGANVTTFTDSAIVEGITYCYRLRASNTAGDSAYSNIAGRLVPFTVPAAPSTLGVAGGP